jgi:predicted transglutaminase-like cysteine proteinase
MRRATLVCKRLAVVLALSLGQAVAVAGPREEWLTQARAVAELSRPGQLESVTQWVHRHVRYADDEGDTWSTPFETLAGGTGDCEDFAFTKFALLRAAGWSGDTLRLAYGYTTLTGVRQPHIVVLAYLDGADPQVLDNLSDSPVPLSRRVDLQLVFSFTEQHLWAFADGSRQGSADRLSKWVEVKRRMRDEGSLVPPHEEPASSESSRRPRLAAPGKRHAQDR